MEAVRSDRESAVPASQGRLATELVLQICAANRTVTDDPP